MSLRFTTVMPLFALLGACATDGDLARGGATVLMPPEVEFQWNEAYNQAEEGIVSILTVDVMVYDGLSGEALPQWPVELEVDSAILALPEDLERSDELCDWCVWDAERDRYVSFDESLDSQLTVTTDEAGIARVVVIVDELGFEGEDFESTLLQARVGDDLQVCELLPR